MSTPIQLYAFPTSPYAMKVGCYLSYKALDYEFVGVSPITFRQVAFTGKRQVPVLQIGDDWRLESSQIGIWLDELYPERPLLGTSAAQRAQVLEIDFWISEQVIPTLFRLLVDWPGVAKGVNNGWKLARAVDNATPLPTWVRLLWPVFLKRARFIVRMVDRLDRSQSVAVSQQHMVAQFVGKLAGGPYLGGMQQPSLADLSAFPMVVFAQRFGLQGDADWLADSRVLQWANLLQQQLPRNPFLVPDLLLPGEMPAMR